MKQRAIAIESLVIDGESDSENVMSGCSSGKVHHAPFVIFSPDLQENVGGPYAKYKHAAKALKVMLAGDIVPCTHADITWTIDGKPSPWYNKD